MRTLANTWRPMASPSRPTFPESHGMFSGRLPLLARWTPIVSSPILTDCPLPRGELADLVDLERVAVIGHSQGGLSALQNGGAQIDLGRCAADPDSVAEDGSCLEFLAHQEEIAAEWGLPSAPTGMWPQIDDPRVDAVVAFAPDSDVWGTEYEGVASVEIPALLMGGSGDSLVPPQDVSSTYEHLGSAEKALIVFEERGPHDFHECV